MKNTIPVNKKLLQNILTDMGDHEYQGWIHCNDEGIVSYELHEKQQPSHDGIKAPAHTSIELRCDVGFMCDEQPSDNCTH
jgi:hypothetical protein